MWFTLKWVTVFQLVIAQGISRPEFVPLVKTADYAYNKWTYLLKQKMPLIQQHPCEMH
ncbi:hypothetical protein D3C87_1943910 [compost metagenome]